MKEETRGKRRKNLKGYDLIESVSSNNTIRDDVSLLLFLGYSQSRQIMDNEEVTTTTGDPNLDFWFEELG